MRKRIVGAAFLALLVYGLVSRASVLGAKHNSSSNVDDITRSRGLLDEFRQDIVRKNGYALTKLALNPDVLFHHANTQEESDGARKYNAQFDGIGPSQLDGFAKLLARSKDVNEKVHHSGLEVWQVCKSDWQWKILSVAWTFY